MVNNATAWSMPWHAQWGKLVFEVTFNFLFYTGRNSDVWTKVQVDIYFIHIASTETNDTLEESSDNKTLQKVLMKFIYSEKATKFCKISTNYSSYVLPVE